MTENEIISEWRGECRHEFENLMPTIPFNPWICKKCSFKLPSYYGPEFFLAPAYDSDPAAWDEALFDEIESKRLAQKMINEIIFALPPRGGYKPYSDTWRVFKATPAQKARALAKSITDGREE